ncbi:MAG: hypothetical protein KOO63_05750 [Bacteroidales bacterium]|nr:hypothetical protein [Candidatus Latescibacterota bacterium]
MQNIEMIKLAFRLLKDEEVGAAMAELVKRVDDSAVRPADKVIALVARHYLGVEQCRRECELEATDGQE